MTSCSLPRFLGGPTVQTARANSINAVYLGSAMGLPLELLFSKSSCTSSSQNPWQHPILWKKLNACGDLQALQTLQGSSVEGLMSGTSPCRRPSGDEDDVCKTTWKSTQAISLCIYHHFMIAKSYDSSPNGWLMSVWHPDQPEPSCLSGPPFQAVWMIWTGQQWVFGHQWGSQVTRHSNP